MYTYWAPPSDEFPRARVTADNTIDPAGTAAVAHGEAGLSFESTIIVYLRIEPVGLDPYTNPGTEYTITALVDADLGIVELTPASGNGPSSSFEFLRP